MLSLLFYLTCSNANAEEATPVRQGGSFELTLPDAAASVARALEAEGVADRVSVTITNSREPVLYLYRHPLTLDVKTLKFDKDTRHFSANLFIKDGEEVLTAMPVAGRYEELVEVPVLKARVSNGDVIEKKDIGTVAVPAARLRKDTVMNAEELLGRTPRRVISPDRPVRVSELEAPDILEKGTTVNMHYKTPYLFISTVGEALDAGAVGATIRVRNHDSGAIVQAEVTAADQVVVSGAPKRLEVGSVQ